MNKKVLLTIEILEILPASWSTEEKHNFIVKVFNIPIYGRLIKQVSSVLRGHHINDDAIKVTTDIIDHHSNGMEIRHVHKLYPDNIENNQRIFALCEDAINNDV